MSGMEERGRTEAKNALKVNTSLWTGGKPTKIQKKGTQLPSHITGTLTLEQMSAYQAMYRIEEITALLNQDHLEPPQYLTRSQSPPPKYDAQGKRTNTKEQRYRTKLEVERYRLVEIAWRMIPFYTHPEGYIKPTTFEEKYYIPVSQYPEVNFVGLLLGPRGNTLKRLQLESKCKIAIRGRGSVKEGKSAGDLPDGALNMEDPLHCLIIGDSEDKTYKGVKLCQGVVIKAVTSPEGQNDLKRNQLRDLAELNGTLREDNTPCSICGLQGHKKYDCPERESFANKVVCHRCGQPGHITRDCQSQIPQSSSPSLSSTPSQSRYQKTPATGNASDSQQQPQMVPSRYQNGNYQSRYSSSFSNTPSTSRYGEGTTVSTNSSSGGYQSRFQRSTPSQSQPQYFNNSLYSDDNTYVRQPRSVSPPNHQSYSESNSIPPSTGISSRESTNAPPGLDTYETISGSPGIPAAAPGVPGLDSSMLPPGLSNNNSGSPLLPPGLIGDSQNKIPPGLSSGINVNKNKSPSLPPGLDEDNSSSNATLPPGLDEGDSLSNPTLPPGLSGPPGL